MTYSIILVQVYNTVITHLYELQSDHLAKSTTRLTPHRVITILLTKFPTRCFPFLWLFFISGNLYLLVSSSFLTHPFNPPPIWQPSICSLFVYVYLFCLDSTYKWDHIIFVFLWLILFSLIPPRSQVANTRPAGRIRPSTLFLPGGSASSMPLVKQ